MIEVHADGDGDGWMKGWMESLENGGENGSEITNQSHAAVNVQSKHNFGELPFQVYCLYFFVSVTISYIKLQI